MGSAMPAKPCTGALRRILPTGHPSRPLAGVRRVPQVLTGGRGQSVTLGPLAVPFKVKSTRSETALARVQGVKSDVIVSGATSTSGRVR